MNVGDARLLLVTDPHSELVERVEAAAHGGVDIVQPRDKESPREALTPLAEELKEACERAGALFTVNDDAELARLVGAGGVHLGEDAAPTPQALSVLGPDAVVGRSAGSIGVALEAVRGGADYPGPAPPASPSSAPYSTPKTRRTRPTSFAGCLRKR